MALFPMPGNTREAAISRREVFFAGLRSFAKYLALAVVLLLIAYLAQIPDVGLIFASAPASLIRGFAVWSAPVFLFWAAGLAALCYWISIRQKGVGIPKRYGFNENGLYIVGPLAEEFFRWEYFLSWKEQPRFFLGSDGVRSILLPKEIWSEEELAQLREYLKKASAKDLP